MDRGYKTIEEIRLDYLNGLYTAKVDVPQRVSRYHIFDEELSVKANREMAAEHNRKVAEAQQEKAKRAAELSKQMSDDVVAYLIGSYNLNAVQARMIENYVYAEKHSYMRDYFASIDDTASFIEAVIKAGY